MISRQTDYYFVLFTIITICSTCIIASGSMCLDSIAISGGEDHTLALTQNRTVFGCGINIAGQLGVDDQNQRTILEQTLGGEMGTKFLENIIKIDSGWTHSLALEDPCGFVWSWGSDGQGQLGDGNGISSRSTPVRVNAGRQNPGDQNDLLRNIVDISAGRSGTHSLAVSDPCGYVWSWGNDGVGQLGDGNDSYSHFMPVQVHGVDDIGFLMNVVSVSAGEEHSMALEIIDPCLAGHSVSEHV